MVDEDDREHDPNVRVPKTKRKSDDCDGEDGDNNPNGGGSEADPQPKKAKKSQGSKKAGGAEDGQEQGQGQDQGRGKKEKTEKQKANALLLSAERKVKELLSLDAKGMIAWKMIQSAVEKEEPKLKFALDKVASITEAKIKVEKKEAEMCGFVAEFRANLMLPNEMKKMRKDLGDDKYHGCLHGVISIYDSEEGRSKRINTLQQLSLIHI
eukprot:976968-Karenia_brevis.AAC.1